jgi:SAM-dependent methyltransferase
MFWFFFLSIIAIASLSAFIYIFGRPFFTGAPYAVSTPEKINIMADMIDAGIGRRPKKIIDLGSGDGRVAIALAERGYDALGIEINPLLVWQAKRSAKKAALANVVFIRGDYWKMDFGDYDAVALFGVFYIMERLERKLMEELKPGALVASNHFAFPNWKPVRSENGIYLYKK